MPAILALLGNRWTWILLGYVVLAAGWTIQTNRLHSAQDRLTALQDEYAIRDRQSQEAADKALQAANERVRAAESKSQADVAAVSAQLQKDTHDALQQKDRIIGQLHTGALALRVQLDTSRASQGNPAAPNQVGKPAGLGNGNQASGLLTETDSAFLVNLASEADATVIQLQAAQRVILDDREICR